MCDCVTIQNEVSMVDMNVKNVYKEEWYDSVSVNEIDNASVVNEMIDVRDWSVKCKIFNIDFCEKKLAADYPCKSHDHDHQLAELVMV